MSSLLYSFIIEHAVPSVGFYERLIGNGNLPKYVLGVINNALTIISKELFPIKNSIYENNNTDGIL